MSGNKKYRVLRGFHRINHEEGTEPYFAVDTAYDGPIDSWYLADDPDYEWTDSVGNPRKGMRVGMDGAGPLLVEVSDAEFRKLKSEQGSDDSDSPDKPTAKPADAGKES